MTGNNTLILNQATMNEAVEYWLKHTQLKQKAKVKKVTFDSGNGKYSGDSFVVELLAVEEDEGAQNK